MYGIVVCTSHYYVRLIARNTRYTGLQISKFLSYYPLESIIMIESKQEVSMDTNDIEQDLIINSCLLIGE